jgi:hypothetical protein
MKPCRDISKVTTGLREAIERVRLESIADDDDDDRPSVVVNVSSSESQREPKASIWPAGSKVQKYLGLAAALAAAGYGAVRAILDLSR